MSTPVWTPVTEGLRKKPLSKGGYTYQSILYFDATADTKSMRHPSDAAAKKWHRSRLGDLDNGMKPARKDITLEQLKVIAFDYHRFEIARDGGIENRIRAKTLENYERTWNFRIADHPIAGLRLDQIDQAAAIRFCKYLRTLGKSESNRNGLASNTLNETLAVVRNVLRYGREEGYMTIDPFNAVPRKFRPAQEPEEKNVKAPLSPGDLKRLLLATATEEFLGATDTLFQNAVIQSALEGERAEQAKGLGGFDDCVYTLADGSGTPINRYQLRNAIQRAGRIAGLGDDLTTMNMRKTTSTGDYYAGVSDEDSAAAHGHDVAVRRRHYVMPIETLEQLRSNAQKRADFFGLGELDLGS